MSETPEESKKKVTPFNIAVALALVVAIQSISMLVTYQNKPVYIVVGQVSPGPFSGSTTGGSIGDAIILLFLVFATTLVLVWLVRKRLMTSFKTIVFVAVSFSAFVLTWFTIDALVYRFPWYTDWFTQPLEITLSLIPVAVIGYTVFVKSHPVLSTAILGLVSAEVGSFFASTLLLPLPLLLPILFGLYDIYAVFRGPLRQLVSAAPSGALAGMSVRAGEFTLGLGDTVFYSMLPSLSMFYLTVADSIYTLIVVDAGVVVTLYLLTRRRLLPGLPIPMFLGVLVFVLLYYGV